MAKRIAFTQLIFALLAFFSVPVLAQEPIFKDEESYRGSVEPTIYEFIPTLEETALFGTSNGSEISIKLENVHDSRCPVDTNCVLEGTAIVDVTITVITAPTMMSEHLEPTSLKIPLSISLGSRANFLGVFTLHFQGLEPPMTEDGVKKLDYVATFRLEHYPLIPMLADPM